MIEPSKPRGIFACLLALLCSAAAGDAEERLHPGWRDFEPRFTEQICPFRGTIEYDPAIVTCGYVLVPEDRTDPNSRLISLAVVKIAHSKTPIARIVYLQGGPGWPAIAAPYLPHFLTEPAWATAEVVLVDQRGTGFSEPNFCRAIPPGINYGVPMVPEGRELRDAAMKQCLDEARRKGVAVDTYSTWHIALDVRDIRRALGYDRWTLLGVSYGAQLAQAVMHVDPEGVRAGVLDSALPLVREQGYGFEFRAQTLRPVLDQLTAACDQQPGCRREYGDIGKLFEDVIRSYEDDPLVLEGMDPEVFHQGRLVLDAPMLAIAGFLSLYNTDIYPEFPMLWRTVGQRDPESIKPLFAISDSADHRKSSGLAIVAICRGSEPASQAELTDALAGEPELARWLQAGIADYCRKSYKSYPDPVHDKPLTTSTPVLILSGSMDPTTPPGYSRSILRGLTNSTFVEFPYTGHVVLATRLQGCGGRILEDFLIDPNAKIDTSCVASIPPPEFVIPGEQ